MVKRKVQLKKWGIDETNVYNDDIVYDQLNEESIQEQMHDKK